jgi:hypothetical protein
MAPPSTKRAAATGSKKRFEKVDEEKKADTIGALFESLKPCPDRPKQPSSAGISGEPISLDP